MLPLPPNRTGSFPASGSPVDGVYSETKGFEVRDRLWRYRPFTRAAVRLNSPASSKKRLRPRV